MKLGEILLRVGALFAIVFGALLVNDWYQKRKRKSLPGEDPDEDEKGREE